MGERFRLTMSMAGMLALALGGAACERGGARAKDAKAQPPVASRKEEGLPRLPKTNPAADVPRPGNSPGNSEEVLAAVKSGNVAAVESYLRSGGSPDALTPNGLSTLLGAASRQKQPEVVAVLLKAGANPNLIATTGVAPLHNAVDARTVELLLAAGADPDIIFDVSNQTPLHGAVRRTDDLTEAPELLLKAGASTQVRDDRGLTPLHHAAMLGNYQMCRLLLRHGAARNSRESRGKTPLDLARSGGHGKVVKLLEGGEGSAPE